MKYRGNLSIILKKSVNGIPFFTKKADVRKILGKPDTNSLEDRPPESEVNRAMELMEVAIKETYKKMGKDPSTFRWPDISPYEVDLDNYGSYQLEYNKQESLVAVVLLAERSKGLKIEVKDCSSFDLKVLLSVADDFVKEEDGAAYVSYSKQMAIWCPDADGRVESLTFASPGYYEKE